jgi:hypothetical protein
MQVLDANRREWTNLIARMTLLLKAGSPAANICSTDPYYRS